MLPEYRTIYQGGEDEIVEKKSRFIASVIPVENEEEDGYYSGDWQESIFCIQDLVCAKVLSMVKKEVRWDL